MQDDNIGSSADRDINDVFSDIFLIENRAFEQSFNEGRDQGKTEDNVEAFHLGYHRGAEIGAEIGYYAAVTNHFIQNKPPGDDKLTKELATLKQMLVEFPRENNQEVDIIAQLSQIRAKFKKICAVLKIQPTFPEPNRLSF
ncbi:protein LTO1 homolog isoform X2 [Zophobas morio]|uniref:protein LTO1 homolog isoform X2 n=1 Tax=Zophobas morio TaxID=2755281 RepID=UPI003083C172